MSQTISTGFSRGVIVEPEDDSLVRSAISLNAKILGLALGVIVGLAIFTATIWLVLKGGEPLGPHLALLGQFLPGYSVSLLGSFVGLGYGLVLGYLGGWLVGWLYNGFLFLRSR